jgi:hypothetical protein
MNDPLYGKEKDNTQSGSPRIRSLQIKNHDIYIDDGSPVSVRLDAPLKLTISSGVAPSIGPVGDERVVEHGTGRHFSKQQEMEQEGPFVPGGLPFLRPPGEQPPAGATPSAPPNAVQRSQPPAQRASGSDF